MGDDMDAAGRRAAVDKCSNVVRQGRQCLSHARLHARGIEWCPGAAEGPQPGSLCLFCLFHSTNTLPHAAHPSTTQTQPLFDCMVKHRDYYGPQLAEMGGGGGGGSGSSADGGAPSTGVAAAAAAAGAAAAAAAAGPAGASGGSTHKPAAAPS